MKSPICLWNDLTLQDARELSSCESAQQIKSWLCTKFNMEHEEPQIKDKILLDLYYYTILFSKEKSFNEEQTSSFFSIVKNTHEKAIETSFGNLEETFSYFKDLIACHSAKRPPFCVHIFQVHEIKAITDYVLKTYFRHFKLYKYAFTPKIIMNVSITYQGVPEETVEENEELNPDIAVEDEQTESDNKAEDANEDAIENNDPPAVQELKSIIEATLEDQITKLKVSVDQKLKANEEAILKSVAGEKKKINPPRSARKGKKK